MNELRRLRFNAKLDVRELSAKTGVPATTIYNLERGDIAHPRLKTVQPLAEFFEVPVGDLAAKLASSTAEAAA